MIFKRIFDIFFSFIGLLLLIPVFLVISLIIKFRSPGPIIFKQKRVAKGGRLFTIYKFRTMYMNHQGGTVSVRGDKRITSLGSFLRKYKLDELPELWNVLKGDMSLVGPRPDVPEYYEKLKGEEKEILKLRPGITGPATLKYANEEELLASFPDPQRLNDEVLWPDKIRINLEYYYNRTFIGDIEIIMKTVFRGRRQKVED